VRIIARRTLRGFWEIHPDSEQPLKAWFKEAKAANWAQPQDVKRMHGSASIVANNRVVFNIGGNKNRMVVKINYDCGIAYIRYVGTHAEYDRIDVETV
jgi:mRNA interferase HigB